MLVQDIYKLYRDDDKEFYRDGKMTKDWSPVEKVKKYFMNDHGCMEVHLYSADDKSSVKPYVLFKEFGSYVMTNKHNYYAMYRNESELYDFRQFDTVESILEYVEKYFKITSDNITIMED